MLRCRNAPCSLRYLRQLRSPPAQIADRRSRGRGRRFGSVPPGPLCCRFQVGRRTPYAVRCARVELLKSSAWMGGRLTHGAAPLGGNTHQTFPPPAAREANLLVSPRSTPQHRFHLLTAAGRASLSARSAWRRRPVHIITPLSTVRRIVNMTPHGVDAAAHRDGSARCPVNGRVSVSG